MKSQCSFLEDENSDKAAFLILSLRKLQIHNPEKNHTRAHKPQSKTKIRKKRLTKLTSKTKQTKKKTPETFATSLMSLNSYKSWCCQ